jgi:MFS family permease
LIHSSSVRGWLPAFFIATRVVQGIGGAMMFCTNTPMLISAYPPGDRGKVLGINIAAVYIGLTVGPFIGGMLTQHLGWRSIFIFTAILSATTALFTLGIAKEGRPAAEGESFDVTATTLYAISLFALMYGFSALPDWRAACLIGVGIISFGFFVRQQLKNPFPLVDIHLFVDNRVFAFSNLAALINYCATFTFITVCWPPAPFPSVNPANPPAPCLFTSSPLLQPKHKIKGKMANIRFFIKPPVNLQTNNSV